MQLKLVDVYPVSCLAIGSVSYIASAYFDGALSTGLLMLMLEIVLCELNDHVFLSFLVG